MNKLCHDTDGLFGYSEAECLSVLTNQTYKMDIHNEQKFGALNRVYTTPGVFLNGVEVEYVPYDAEDWRRFMTYYIAN
eukprot:CAMPEP_0168334570 /NCGR_PEP_ID=MMETSP0213-20121227/10356_1 /TAXON_ID=151035 /ORGANISM="Euplotes harpa, Strain FSP1.4" /LENGTH=77 /DNA_ID=CAMNT_0008339259 /DNA_START=416 /DNA_END=649 /DNA_ORIENTATION=+